MREYLTSALRKGKGGGGLRCIQKVVEDGGERRVEMIVDAREVARGVTGFFEEWFGKGRRRWYLDGWKGFIVGEGVHTGSKTGVKSPVINRQLC